MSDLRLIVTRGDEDVTTNPGIPTPPSPGKITPPKLPPDPDEEPDLGPTGPRTPYPNVDPSIQEPPEPGSEPDHFPGIPTDPGVRRLRRSEGSE